MRFFRIVSRFALKVQSERSKQERNELLWSKGKSLHHWTLDSKISANLEDWNPFVTLASETMPWATYFNRKSSWHLHITSFENMYKNLYINKEHSLAIFCTVDEQNWAGLQSGLHRIVLTRQTLVPTCGRWLVYVSLTICFHENLWYRDLWLEFGSCLQHSPSVFGRSSSRSWTWATFQLEL